MSLGKQAAISSSLSAPFTGKRPAPPAPRPKPQTSPGLGEKMRQETSHALESMLKKSSFQTGLEALVKAAAASIPAARVVPKGSGVRTPTPAPMPAPAAGAGPAPTPLPQLPHPMMAAARGLPGQAWGAVKRPLALGALGAGAALAYGMHHQNQEDHDRNSLVYAPMTGSVMG